MAVKLLPKGASYDATFSFTLKFCKVYLEMLLRELGWNFIVKDAFRVRLFKKEKNDVNSIFTNIVLTLFVFCIMDVVVSFSRKAGITLP